MNIQAVEVIILAVAFILPFIFYKYKNSLFFVLIGFTILSSVISAYYDYWIIAWILLLFPIIALIQFIIIRNDYDPEADNKINKLLKKQNLTDQELDELYWLRRKTKASYKDKLKRLWQNNFCL